MAGRYIVPEPPQRHSLPIRPRAVNRLRWSVPRYRRLVMNQHGILDTFRDRILPLVFDASSIFATKGFFDEGPAPGERKPVRRKDRQRLCRAPRVDAYLEGDPDSFVWERSATRFLSASMRRSAGPWPPRLASTPASAPARTAPGLRMVVGTTITPGCYRGIIGGFHH